MAKDYAIRGNSKMTQVDRDTITSDQLAQYLEAEVLGCPIKTDFITTHGPGGGCYVVLDLTIHDQYLTQQARTGNYVENFLAKHAAASKFNGGIIDALKPFMFPEDWTRVLSSEEAMKKLTDIGILGGTLSHIRMHSVFRKSETYNEWAIALDTEKLLRHYYSNPTTGEMEGQFRIVEVAGERAPGITWTVEIIRDGSIMSSAGVTVDAIFRSVR